MAAKIEELDELFVQAGKVVTEAQRGSVTLLQNKLVIGYGRASRIIDQLEEKRILGPFQAGKPRDVLFTLEDFNARFAEPATKTTAIARLDQQIELFGSDTMRGQACRAVRDFRRSWVELGEKLVEISRGGDYRDWGYDEFEVYCARELGIKKNTARKLMVSYNYLKSYEPKMLSSAIDNGTAIPDYKTLCELNKARENDCVDQEQIQEIHVKVFHGDIDESGEKAIRDHIREITTPAQLPGHEDFAYLRRKVLADILRTTRVLRRKLSQANNEVPDGLRDRTEQLLVEFEGLE